MKRILSSLPAIIVMGVIFYFSAMDGDTSHIQSEKVSTFFADLVNFFRDLGFDGGAKTLAGIIEVIVRKIGHITEYCILSVMVYIPHGIFVPVRYKRYLVTFVFCVIYAASDEIHQAFVPGRGPGVTDVLIDSCGVLLGLLIALILDAFFFNQKEGKGKRFIRSKNDE